MTTDLRQKLETAIRSDMLLEDIVALLREEKARGVKRHEM
jgi:hypothetical protein